MFYSIRHLTEFRYGAAVSESVMEVRMQPRSEGSQRCLTFDLSATPQARVMSYRDFWGNFVHHFGIPGAHSELTVIAQALVEVQPASAPGTIEAGDWTELDAQVASGDHWDMLSPSHFVQPVPLLQDLAQKLRAERRDTPLGLLRELNDTIYETFDYVPKSTEVDSPIDEALRKRQGVCQDFAHIMIALVRQLHIPCRYVSGYLAHSSESKTRSAEGATHAWAEAWLPGPGWVGFDPTNRLIAGDHHLRVAVGRDYADVPPTLGVYKGEVESELRVAVRVAPSNAPLPGELPPASVVHRTRPARADPRQAMHQEQ